MPNTRIYQPIALKPGETIALTADAIHYLTHVLRIKKNDPLTLFNGQGGEYAGIVSDIDKKNIRVFIQEFNPREAESSLELYLAQGISRGEKMDFTIQKAVELGVKKIIPLFTERSTVKLDQERREKRYDHWQSIIINACQQSGRNRIPELCPLMGFEAGLSAVSADYKLILSPDSSSKLKELPLQKTQKILLLIGPEGGLSQCEVDWALGQGFMPLTLGPRILRTETAGIVAMTAIQCLVGDY